MNDCIHQSFATLRKQVETAHKTLSSAEQSIEDRRQQIITLLTDGITYPKAPAGNGLFFDICRTALETLNRRTREWAAAVAADVERSEFVNRHEKSVLIMVFADVKTGKSCLGNMVSGYDLRGTAYEELFRPLTYHIEQFSEASTENRAIHDREMPFPEDEIEATSAIQYYTLFDGLTWVDTPGLHSLTHEHGDLAKEYIKFADLVLFLTSSSSPMKLDEKGIVEELFSQDKPVLTLITKSDKSSKAVIDGKLVSVLQAKSKADRDKQEAEAIAAIRAMPGSWEKPESRSVLSISTKLARRALKEQDEFAFHDSHIPIFFERLGTVLSEQALALKLRRPKTELNSCIEKLAGTKGMLQEQRQVLQQRYAELTELESKKTSLVNTTVQKLYATLPARISLRLRSLREQKKLDDAQSVKQAISAIISDTAAEACLAACEEVFQSAQLKITIPEIKLGHEVGGGYQITTETRQYTKLTEREPSGLIEHIVRLVDKDKKFYSRTHEHENVAVGDNFNAFLESNWNAVKNDVETYVEQVVAILYQQYVAPLKDCYSAIDEQMDKISEQLNGLKIEF